MPLREITTTINDDQLDAFSNLRVTPPSFVADGQLTYDLQPLLYEQITVGDGAISHDTTNRCANLSINTATGSGDKAVMQSFQHYRYQAGRSQEVFITFNFKDNTGVSNIRKFVQYGDDTNGVGFELNGTSKNFFIKSGSDTGNQSAEQSTWNIDKLDGTGKSGITLDTSKTHILVLDIQALYVGRVRFGFDIDGMIIWAHEILHANNATTPYIQTANLPISAGLISSASTATNDDMLFICSCVLSRGGQEQVAGYDFSVQGSVTAGNESRTHLLSVRPKTTFNSFTNRVEFVLEDIDILNDGANPIYWELCLGQTLSGSSWADANGTYSAFEYDETGSASGSPDIVVASGYLPDGAFGGTASKGLTANNRYPITLDAAGAVRGMGTLTLLVSGVGGASACRGEIHWRELR